MTGSDDLRQRAENIFHDVRELDPEARRRQLDERCAGHDALRTEVESLLREYDGLGTFLEEPAVAPLDVPRSIGPYRLLSPLGRGGMGEVWLAEQTEPIRRRVAIKVIRPGMDSRDIVARFEAERQALAMMDHPGVASVHDAGTTDRQQPYFVMEHVDGEPITDYARTHRLSVRDRVDLFRQVCAAIQHAHQKTILHRDVKPSNVLVTEVDGRPRVKVIDFGVAKALGDRIGDQTLVTVHGSVIGTPEYMSPEQAGARVETVDTRSDVYSLGVILYELMVGALPHEPATVREAMSMGALGSLYDEDAPRPTIRLQMLGPRRKTVAEHRGTTLAGLEAALRGELEWIVMKAIAPEPGRRYQSPADLSEDLLRHLDGESVEAAPPSRTYRARKFVRRHRAAVATVGVIAFGLVLGAAGLAFGLVRALDAEERASRDARTAEEITDFLVDLFRVNEPGAAADTLVTARAILDRGADEIRASLDDDPLVRGNLLNTMSEAYWGLGLYARADSLARLAVDDLEGVLEDSDARLADARRQWSQSRFYAGDYRGALDIAQSAFDARAAAFGPYDEKAVELRNVRAQLVGRIGDPEEARAEFVDLIAYLQGGTGPSIHTALVSTWNNLAAIHFRGRDFPDAENALERALTVLDSTNVEEPGRRVRLMMNIAAARAQQGNLEEATPMLERALPELERIYGPAHMETIGARMNLAAFRQMSGDTEGAADAYATVLPRAEAALGPDHPQVARVLHSQGVTLNDLGRHDEAIVALRRAVEIRTAIFGPDHDDTVASLLSLATGYGGAGDTQRLRSAFDDVVSRRARKFGEDHVEVARDLDVYAEALAANGLEDEAAAIRTRAARIRDAQPEG